MHEKHCKKKEYMLSYRHRDFYNGGENIWQETLRVKVVWINF